MWYYSTSSSFILLLFTQHIYFGSYSTLFWEDLTECVSSLYSWGFTWEWWSCLWDSWFFFVHACLDMFDISFISDLLLASHWHQITSDVPHLSFWVNDIACGKTTLKTKRKRMAGTVTCLPPEKIYVIYQMSVAKVIIGTKQKVAHMCGGDTAMCAY